MIRFLQKPRRSGAANAVRADARPRGDVRNHRAWAAGAAAAVLSIGVGACGGSDDSGSGGDGAGGTVNLVAYSTPQEVYQDELIPGFQATPEGEGVEFTTSFAGSGDSRRAVESGIPTDLVHLPLEPDMTILEEQGLIPSDYRDNETGGSPQESVVVFVTRPGNPKNVETWDDVLDGDLEIINANPFTSGGARWNVMAAYGQAIEAGGTEEDALEAVRKLLEKVPTYPASARDALNEFLGGKGDVLLSYENEAIQAQRAGEEVDYVIPESTILIETLAAVATDAENPEGAQQFYDYLVTEDAQRIWAENGYRPILESVAKDYTEEFPEPQTLFTIDDLGGWDTVMTDLFDVDNGAIAEIQTELGGPTE